MKISQMTSDQAFDLFCEITVPVSNIMGDKDLLDEIAKAIPKDSNIFEIYTFATKKISTIVSLIFKNHREDVYNILAPLNGKTVQEIAEQKFIDTLNQIKSIKDDEDLINFFKSWQQ